MPTATDALQAAADELHGASVAIYEVRDEVRAGLAQSKAAATTVITNFLRAGSKNYFLDQIGGLDTNDGLDVTKPKRTMDAILDAIEIDGTTIFGANVFALSDMVMRYHHIMPSPISIVGAEWGGGNLGSPYRLVQRTLTFQTEALNSPIQSIGRTPPAIRSIGSSIRLTSLNIAMPDVPSNYDSKTLLSMVNGGTIVCDTVTLSCATAGSAVNLIGAAGPVDVVFAGTLGTNAPGKVFAGIAAGANPNSQFLYRTNLTSA